MRSNPLGLQSDVGPYGELQEVDMNNKQFVPSPARHGMAVRDAESMGSRGSPGLPLLEQAGTASAAAANAGLPGGRPGAGLVERQVDPLDTVSIGAAPDRLLREKQVLEIIGMGRSSLWSYSNPRSRYHDPSFPKPVKIGARAVAWRMSEIFGWVASRRAFK